MLGGDGTGIGFQLSMYRMLDAFEKARELRAAANEQTLSDYYRGQYNDLSRRFNALYDAVRDTAPKVGELEHRVRAQELELQAKDARITELEENLRGAQGYANMLLLQMREQFETSVALSRAADQQKGSGSQ